jgi:hypothetical protein
MLLEHWKLLTKPLLYLSLFFKRRREDYYRRLNAVRIEGDWEGWLDFFLDGLGTIADEAVDSARELFALVAADRLFGLRGAQGDERAGVAVLDPPPATVLGRDRVVRVHWPIITFATSALTRATPSGSRRRPTIVPRALGSPRASAGTVRRSSPSPR